MYKGLRSTALGHRDVPFWNLSPI